MKKLFFILSIIFGSLIVFVLVGILSILFFYKEPTTWVDLGDGYDYLNEYGIMFDCFAYHGDGIFYQAIPFIFPKIEEYKFNENYITAKQKYSKQNSSKLLETILCFHEQWGKIDTNVFPIYDSIMYDTFEKYYKLTRTSMEVQAFCDSIVDSNPYFKEMEKYDYNYYRQSQYHKIWTFI